MVSALVGRSSPRPRGLKARLLGAFLLLSVVPLAAGGALVYRQGEALLQRELWNRLTALTLLKGQHIQAWVRERQNDVVRPASLETFQRRLATLVARAETADGAQAEREIRQILERLRATGEFTEMFVIEPERGRVLLSTDPSQEGKFKRDRPYFREGRKGPYVQHVYYSMVLGRPVMAFSAPVDHGGRLLAILVARVDLRFLDRLMSERSGLGSMGQTFLVNRFNYFVSDSLGRGDTGWRPVFSEGVTRALAGVTGTAAYVNHAGHRVVGAHHWIPELELALIAEMHEDEGLAPIRAFRLALIAVLGLIAGAAVVVGACLSYAIARPITRLDEAARSLGEGRLGLRVNVEGPRELAMLGRSFNAMAESLEAAQGTLRRKVADRTEELATLNELAELTAQAQTVETLLDRSLDRLLRVIKGEVAVAFLVDGGAFRLVAHRGIPPEVITDLTAHPPEIGQGIVGEVAASGRLITLDELSQDPRVLRSGVRDLGIRAFVAFPLSAEGRVLGVVGLGASTATPVPADRLTFLEVLSTQLGAVIENLRLNKRATDRAERLRTLSALTRLITGVTEDTREVYEEVARSATTLLGARLARVWVSDPGAALLRSEGIFGIDPALATEAVRSATIGAGHGATGETFRTREPQYFADVQRDPRFLNPAWAREAGLHAAALVPLVTATGVVGVLSIFFAARPPFTDEEKDLMRLLADQAAIVIAKGRLYDEARHSLAALENKNAELDSFVFSVSHDLKAPLIAVQGMAGALLEDCGAELDSHGRHYLNRLQANVEQMERLIRDLLALSRIGRESRTAETVSVAELVDDIVAEYSTIIRARSIKVTVTDVGTLHGVRTQIEQVFTNLIGNAIKYAGHVESPIIEIGTAHRGGFIECYVKDNGIGIDPVYHAKVFEIFQRLQDVEVEGTGVGLAIVKKIVEAAGGRIWVESARSEGATFRFTWPAGSNGGAR